MKNKDLEIEKLSDKIEQLQIDLDESQAMYDYECGCNEQFVKLQDDYEILKNKLEIYKTAFLNEIPFHNYCDDCVMFETEKDRRKYINKKLKKVRIK